jgi:hypothetical protein
VFAPVQFRADRVDHLEHIGATDRRFRHPFSGNSSDP